MYIAQPTLHHVGSQGDMSCARFYIVQPIQANLCAGRTSVVAKDNGLKNRSLTCWCIDLPSGAYMYMHCGLTVANLLLISQSAGRFDQRC